MKKEEEGLRTLWEMEDLAEKKTAIYARLLIDTSLAKKMEELSLEHGARRAEIEKLLYGKERKKDGGRVATNGDKEEKA